MNRVFKEVVFWKYLQNEDLGNMAWGTQMVAVVGKSDLEIFLNTNDLILTRCDLFWLFFYQNITILGKF